MLPESPRWLAGQGNTREALNVLTAVMDRQCAQSELRNIEAALQGESEDWRELLGSGISRPLAVGLALTVLSVTVGINAVILYGPVILIRGAGDDIAAAMLGAVVMGLVNFVFSLVAMVTVDRAGRKPLLLCGLLGMCVSLIALANRFSLGASGSSLGLMIPILTFLAFYAVSLGPITWVLVSEIFPTKLRGIAVALCMVVMYLADFAVTLTFPWMMERIGSGAFHVFAAICGAGVLFVWACVPETKGKSLEQIEAMWLRRTAKQEIKL
jgi:MFS family permease